MRISKKLLPCETEEWHGFFRTYFCDKDASVTLDEDNVVLELAWPTTLDRHIDPLLEVGLAWWGRNTTISSMWDAKWREGKILTTLYDTWTLYSWSEWLTKASKEYIENVTILHVDDHKDLGTPRLFMQGTSLVDPITGKNVDVKNPRSVQDAIQSGALGMGSFITPFMHAVTTASVRHLCQPPKITKTVEYEIKLTCIQDTLLKTDEYRPAIELFSSENSGNLNYLGTNDTYTWIKNLEGKPVLIHIDMDYFNNRFDGDSDWKVKNNRLDPDLLGIFNKIDELLDALATSKAIIEDIAIAYSPGFFPAEHWEAADDRLRSGLKKILR